MANNDSPGGIAAYHEMLGIILDELERSEGRYNKHQVSLLIFRDALIRAMLADLLGGGTDWKDLIEIFETMKNNEYLSKGDQMSAAVFHKLATGKVGKRAIAEESHWGALKVTIELLSSYHQSSQDQIVAEILGQYMTIVSYFKQSPISLEETYKFLKEINRLYFDSLQFQQVGISGRIARPK